MTWTKEESNFTSFPTETYFILENNMSCPGFGEVNIPSSRAFWDDCEEDEIDSIEPAVKWVGTFLVYSLQQLIYLNTHCLPG